MLGTHSNKLGANKGKYMFSVVECSERFVCE